MEDHHIPPSSKFQSFDADLNSNQFTIAKGPSKDNLTLQDCKLDSNIKDNFNKGFTREKPSPTANSPTSIFGTSLHQKDLSYDDLSKNIDANLAEIDMETFRSEDINSILALPAIYSGNFQSASHGEQCASVSGSLLNGLELDASVGNRNSEDEISICKDELLFSPLREPPVPESAISVDSLDNSSSYEQDLVLTCKANKDNYTIAFEGSETQFSDDSDYHNVCRSSEGESSVSAISTSDRSCCYIRRPSSMAQSDLVFTTWSNLKRTHFRNKRRNYANNISIKSQSLPNLCHHSVFIGDKQLFQLGKQYSNKHFSLPPSGLQLIRSSEYTHSLSLLKLFMKHRVPSSNSVGSSSHSNSSSSLIIHPLNCRSLQNSLNISDFKSNDHIDVICNNNTNDSNQRYKIKKHVGCENANETEQTQLFIDNIRILDWNSVQNVAEANNNTINSLYIIGSKVPNNNCKEETLIIPTGQCDNSQYFEDSLVDTPIFQVKNFHTMPIKEEEETDTSSGDEIMRESDNKCSNGNSSLENAAIIKNNTVDLVTNVARQEGDQNLERINNIFPSCKSNVPFSCAEEEKLPSFKKECVPENQTQSTQTKRYNSGKSVAVEGIQVPVTKMTSIQTSGEVHTRHYGSSRDSSPNSSGYASSRHSSVERLQRSTTHGKSVDLPSEVSSKKKSNVSLATTRTCSTQVPVHVKDTSMQTSTSSNSNMGFTLKDAVVIDATHTESMKQTGIKLKHSNTVPHVHKSLQKDDKCIYVCYPNYSLPDLSFLKSVIGEESGSVFLTPTKFKPPQESAGKHHYVRPKSCGGLDSSAEKHFSGIKDWDSLSVLLPEDLKNLISQIRLKKSKLDANVAGDNCSKIKLPKTQPTKASKSEENLIIPNGVAAANIKEHTPRSILRKSSSIGQREEKQKPVTCCSSPSSSTHQIGDQKLTNNFEIPSAYTFNGQLGVFSKNKHQIKVKETTPVVVPQPQNVSNKRQNSTYVSGTNDLSRSYATPKEAYVSEVKHTHTCCNCAFNGNSSAIIHNAHFERVRNKDCPVTEQFQSELYQARNKGVQEFNGKNIEMCPRKNIHTSHPCKILKQQRFTYCNKGDAPLSTKDNYVENANVHMTTMQFGKAFKHCEKDSTVEPDYSVLSKTKPWCNIQNKSQEDFHNSGDTYSSNYFDLEKPPQEFLVSPVENTQPYSIPPDLYMFQDSSRDEHKLLQEVLKKKTGLVENLQKATQMIFDHCRTNNMKQNVSCYTSFSVGQKILTSLCPAVHTILSDGLLPSVRGFFGPLPNSPWKVAEASVQQGKSKKEIQDLLSHVNSEKLLTDSTYRFNAFIIGLLNLGCLEWWLGHLLSSENLICNHYHPSALLSLLAHPETVHLQQELKELVSPLSNLPFSLDLTFETKVATGDGWRKGEEDTFKTSKPTPENKDFTEEKRKSLQFTFQYSPHSDQDKKSELDFKDNYNLDVDFMTLPKTVMNIMHEKRECQGHQVWPGISTNPFPNARFSEESNQTFTHEKNIDHNPINSNLLPSFDSNTAAFGGHKATSGRKEKDTCKSKRLPPELSFCSSRDSGCISQTGHAHEISLAATNSGESGNNALVIGDGHQFRKLRQKWEKITLGLEKQPNSKKLTQKTSTTNSALQNNSKSRKKVGESQVSMATENSLLGKVTIKDEASKARINRAVSQPPACRKNVTNQSGTLRKTKIQAQDACSASKGPSHVMGPEKKGKSQIPMLKFGKNKQPKSKIPVQATGIRTRSVGREPFSPEV